VASGLGIGASEGHEHGEGKQLPGGEVEAPLSSGLGGRRRLTFEGEPNAACGEDIVGGVQEVEDPAHSHVGDGLIHDLLRLDGGDPDGERGAQHHLVLGKGSAGDQRGHLDHQPGAGVEAAVAEHCIKGEVVEDLDQLRVCYRER
jgi:hypothetical protein